MENNKMKYFPKKPWELREGKGYKPSSESGEILSKLGNSKTNKIALGVLYALVAAFGVGVAKEVFGEEFMEKLVVSDQDGNITPVLNKNGEVNIGSSIFVSEDLWYGVRGVFDKNNYICTDEDSDKLSIRDNKTLEEVNYITAKPQGKPAVDLETETKASIQYINDINPRQIQLLFKDGSQQTLPPNPYEPKSSSYQPNINALEFSDSKLYAATSTDQQKKHWIQVFKEDGEGKFVDTGNKIALPEEFEAMAVHNGKIAVISGEDLYIYDKNTLQEEKVLPTMYTSVLVGKPGNDEVFLYLGDIKSVKLSSPHTIKTVVPEADLTKLLDNDWDYVPSSAAFSPDGNRFYFATKSYTGQDKSVHYIVTIYLNPDGSVQKMEKSVLTPGPTPLDLAMDVDTDKQGNISKPDAKTNAEDNCPDIYNPKQIDLNNNGIGDACEDTEKYAASQGYESYQEPADTGHNVFSNGNVEIKDEGNKVVVYPAEGEDSEIEIISNGLEQTKDVYVYIPPNTKYKWVSFEGFGDDKETTETDFPEGETIEKETAEKGILAGISGTHVKAEFSKKIIQSDEIDQGSEETSADDVFEGADEVSIPDQAKPDEIIPPDELTPDTAEIVPDAIDSQDVYEITPDTTPETTPETDVIQPPDQFDAYDPGQPDVQSDIQKDTGTDTGSDIIQPDTEKPKDGGGGCNMNNSANKGAEALTLTGAALAAFALFRRKIAKALKG